MKIVNRQTFLALPPETLFSKYTPQVFDDLMIKGETWGSDFLYQSISDAVDCHSSSELFDVLDNAEKSGSEFQMDFDCWSRDGLFDTDQLYVVWGEGDVESLRNRLSRIC